MKRFKNYILECAEGVTWAKSDRWKVVTVLFTFFMFGFMAAVALTGLLYVFLQVLLTAPFLAIGAVFAGLVLFGLSEWIIR